PILPSAAARKAIEAARSRMHFPWVRDAARVDMTDGDCTNRARARLPPSERRIYLHLICARVPKEPPVERRQASELVISTVESLPTKRALATQEIISTSPGQMSGSGGGVSGRRESTARR